MTVAKLTRYSEVKCYNRLILELETKCKLTLSSQLPEVLPHSHCTVVSDREDLSISSHDCLLGWAALMGNRDLLVLCGVSRVRHHEGAVSRDGYG